MSGRRTRLLPSISPRQSTRPPLSSHVSLSAALFVALLLIAPAVRLTAAGAREASPYTITTANSKDFGSYLTDAQGNALYYSTQDLPGASECTAGCEIVWPPFTVSRVIVPSNLDPSAFGYIIRDNGRRQITFHGWPLYYYSRDWAPHDTNGQGLYGSWYLVRPALFGPAGN
ncbi:MAG TPA: hypothetical protein VMW69_10860 [Spirochaetia bacterium]|nr:hypothetical protein [Spirochaetia bacterium]